MKNIDKNKIIELAKNGLSQIQIANKLDISKTCLLNNFKRYSLIWNEISIREHSKGIYNPRYIFINELEFIKLIKDGLSKKEISKYFNISIVCINNKLKEYDVNWNKISTYEHCKGKNNPMFGKNHKSESIEKISKTKTGKPSPIKGIEKTNEFIKKCSEGQKELYKNGREPWNKGLKNCFSKETMDKMFGRKHSIESIEKMSISTSENIINNPGSLSIKGKFYSNKNMKELYYQSSYELKFMKLAEENIEIISYDRCLFSIKYQDKNGQVRRYIPDFIVNKNRIIEIKPEYALTLWNNPEKFKSGYKYAKENDMKFEVWTEKELMIF